MLEPLLGSLLDSTLGWELEGRDPSSTVSELADPQAANSSSSVVTEGVSRHARIVDTDHREVICQDRHMASSASTTSHLGHALLGLLARQELTGYQLSRQMQRPVGYFWTAGHTQIYPELRRLEDAGLVGHRNISGRGPRQTKRYRITAAGTRALRAFVSTETEPQPVRDLETLRLWSLWTVSPETTVTLVRRNRADHAGLLERYRAELDELVADRHLSDPGHPDFASWLTLEGGIRHRQAAVEWCDWMLEQLSGDPAPA